MRLHHDLKDFVELLNAENVRYVVVGGYAIAFHVQPRATGDIDFFVEPNPENARKLIKVLRQFGASVPGLTAADLTQPDQVVQFGRPPHRIDLLTSIEALSFEDA